MAPELAEQAAMGSVHLPALDWYHTHLGLVHSFGLDLWVRVE